MLALMVAVVTANAPPAQPGVAVPPHFYLHVQGNDCDRPAPSDEIVICASNDADKRYRLQPVDPQRYAEAPIRAETRFAGGVLGAAASQTLVGGFASNRIMLRYKLKF